MSSGAGGTGWVRACRVDEIPDEEGLQLPTIPPISVFRSDGELFCVDDTCTHEDYSLAESWVEDCTVECPLHMARFCLRTGAVLAAPATSPLGTYEVRVEGDEVHVRIDGRVTAPDSMVAIEEEQRHGAA